MCVCLKSVLLARSELLHVQLLVVVLFVACPFLSSDWNTAWLVSQVAQYHTNPAVPAHPIMKKKHTCVPLQEVLHQNTPYQFPNFEMSQQGTTLQMIKGAARILCAPIVFLYNIPRVFVHFSPVYSIGKCEVSHHQDWSLACHSQTHPTVSSQPTVCMINLRMMNIIPTQRLFLFCFCCPVYLTSCFILYHFILNW